MKTIKDKIRLARYRWSARLRRLAHKPYDCEQCVGQEHWRGCYCDYHGAVAPGIGPNPFQALVLNLADRINPYRR